MRFPIFLVEDNADDAFLMQRAAEKAGFKGAFQIFPDGMAVIKHLCQIKPGDAKAPALILIDLKLPGFSGLEVLKWIRQAPPWAGLRVIILTSSQLESDRDLALQSGADGFLVKPGSFRELVELARSLEDSAQSPPNRGRECASRRAVLETRTSAPARPSLGADAPGG